MFEFGKEYRVWSLKENMGRREGKLVAAQGSMFALEVDGIHTIFHMAAVAYVELIDEEAETKRDQARVAAQVNAWS